MLNTAILESPRSYSKCFKVYSKHESVSDQQYFHKSILKILVNDIDQHKLLIKMAVLSNALNKGLNINIIHTNIKHIFAIKSWYIIAIICIIISFSIPI